MIEPPIRFCTSADGTRIAYVTLGDPAGAPLVVVNPWAFSLKGSLTYRGWWEKGGLRGRQLVMYDRRGVGASQREIDDLSTESDAADFSAVVDQLQLERSDVLAWMSTGAAVGYAALHAERVGRMVMVAPCARGRDLVGIADLAQVIRANWSIARRSIAAATFPSGPIELQRWMTDMMRDSFTPEMAIRYTEGQTSYDVSDLLPLVRAPTLVVSLTGIRAVPASASSKVAALIPEASFVQIEGDFGSLWDDRGAPLLEAIRQFLDGGVGPLPATSPPGTTALQTILFTDVEGSTALTDRLGDAAARDVMREHERITREALKAHGGSEVKTMGDGFMASFGSATKALECAVAIQKAFDSPDTTVGARHASPLRTEHGIRVRCGLNAGEPIAENDPDGRSDLFGTAVIVAARIAAQAHGGEILVSDVVRQLVAGKNFLFNDRGEQALKGFEDPVHVFEVRWREVDS